MGTAVSPSGMQKSAKRLQSGCETHSVYVVSFRRTRPIEYYASIKPKFTFVSFVGTKFRIVWATNVLTQSRTLFDEVTYGSGSLVPTESLIKFNR